MTAAEQAHDRRSIEIGLELLARLAGGRSLDEPPDGVRVLAQGSWKGPFSPRGPVVDVLASTGRWTR